MSPPTPQSRRQQSRPQQQQQQQHGHGKQRDVYNASTHTTAKDIHANGDTSGEGVQLQTAEGHEWQRLMNATAVRMGHVAPQLSTVLQAGEEHLTMQLKQANADRLRYQHLFEETQLQLKQETLDKSNHAHRLETVSTSLKEKTAECTRLRVEAQEKYSLEEKLHRLESELHSRITTSTNTEMQFAKLKTRTRDLSTEMELKKAEFAKKLERSQAELQEVQARAHDAEAKLKLEKNRAALLQAKCAQGAETVKREVAAGNTQKETTAKEVAVLERRVKDLQHSVERMEQERGHAVQCAEDARNNAQQSQQAAEADRAKHATLAAKNGELHTLLEEATRNAEVLKKKAAKHKAHALTLKTELDKATETAERKNHECLRTSSLLTQYKSESTTLETDLHVLRSQSEELSHAAQVNEERVRSAEQARDEALSLAHRAEEAVAQHKERVAHLEATRADAHEKVTTFSSKADTLQEEIFSLESRLRGVLESAESERAKHAKRCAALEEEARSARNAVHDMQRRLDESDAHREVAEQQCTKYEQSCNDLQTRNIRLEAKAEQHKEHFATLEAEVRHLQTSRLDSLPFSDASQHNNHTHSMIPTQQPPAPRPQIPALSLNVSGISTATLGMGREQEEEEQEEVSESQDPAFTFQPGLGGDSVSGSDLEELQATKVLEQERKV